MAVVGTGRQSSQWTRIAWVAVVACGGLGASFAFWDPLEVDERAHIRRLTAQAASSIAADLEADVHARLLALVRLAQQEGWEEEPGQASSKLEWTLNCRLFLDHYPSYIDLRWLDAEGRVRWQQDRSDGRAVNADSPIGATALPAVSKTISAAEQFGQVSVSPAFRRPDGRVAMLAVVTVVRDSVRIGQLVGEFDVRTALSSMLTDHDHLGFLIAVRSDSTEIFRTAGDAPRGGEAYVHEVGLPLPGTTWRIMVWPDATLLSEMRSSLPELAAVLGGLLGSALLLTWHFGRTAQSKSRELRDARDQLEVRVVQRTSELWEANQRLETQVSERMRAEDSLRNLSGRLLQLQDDERRRIARELHDSTTQMLGALAISLAQAEQVARKSRNRNLKAHLDDGQQVLERVTAEIRTISHLLHPPVLDELGLKYVLPWYVDAFTKRSGIAVALEVQSELGRLPGEVEIAFFRITQEALSNIHRHSGSPTAHISLVRDAETATLRIEDHGSGVPPGILEHRGIASLGIGIAGMRERVRQLQGTLEIAGGQDGTTILAVLPLPRDLAAVAGQGLPDVDGPAGQRPR